MSLDYLRELDPELADWWIERRRKAWREVGLVRSADFDDLIYDGKKITHQLKGTWRALVAEAKKEFAILTKGMRTCGPCGLPARGHAAIGNTPYCHPVIGDSCYVKATVDAAVVSSDWLKEFKRGIK